MSTLNRLIACHDFKSGHLAPFVVSRFWTNGFVETVGEDSRRNSRVALLAAQSNVNPHAVQKSHPPVGQIQTADVCPSAVRNCAAAPPVATSTETETSLGISRPRGTDS